MRAVRRTLLAAVGCMAVVLAFAASGAAQAPAQATSYHWAQPWSLGPASASTQPVVRWAVTSFRPSSAYTWSQPWSMPRDVASTQPPAWIPAG